MLLKGQSGVGSHPFLLPCSPEKELSRSSHYPYFTEDEATTQMLCNWNHGENSTRLRGMDVVIPGNDIYIDI